MDSVLEIRFRIFMRIIWIVVIINFPFFKGKKTCFYFSILELDWSELFFAPLVSLLWTIAFWFSAEALLWHFFQVRFLGLSFLIIWSGAKSRCRGFPCLWITKEIVFAWWCFFVWFCNLIAQVRNFVLSICFYGL